MTTPTRHDPLLRLAADLARAEQSEVSLPDAAVLATVGADGRPSARVILMKSVTAQEAVFYTNYQSRKAIELAANPHAALCIHWKSLGVQVRLAGRCTRLSAAESDAYFDTRPLGRQLGALASDQSRPLESREVLEQRYRTLLQQHRDEPPQRPPHWGGYRLRPDTIEFWTHRENRLHERVLYRRGPDDGWTTSLLYP